MLTDNIETSKIRINKRYNANLLLGIKTKKLELLKDVKEINFVKDIMNCILANNCYSEKEINQQIEKGQNLGNLTTEEVKLLRKSWEFRKKKAKNYLIN